jgi:hypothetical protein
MSSLDPAVVASLTRLGYYYASVDPYRTAAAGGLDMNVYGLGFNPYDSAAWSNPQALQPPTAPISAEDFQRVRSQSTVEGALAQLKALGTDVSTIPVKTLSVPARVLFLCLNTYTTPKLSLGVGPLNDGVTCAANHRILGYTVYFLHNPTTRQFLDYLKAFLDKTREHLTIYYSGHGSQIRDTTGDEGDGRDEVMIFDQGFIVDDDLAGILREHCKGKCRVLLLTDCCRSGTIWDVPEDLAKAERTFPPNILSFSAAQDSQTSKQTSGLGGAAGAQGLFTFNFFRIVRANKGITPAQIAPLINKEIKRYQQACAVSPTRKELLTQPIFPQ